jgi:hypothetical protein
MRYLSACGNVRQDRSHAGDLFLGTYSRPFRGDFFMRGTRNMAFVICAVLPDADSVETMRASTGAKLFSLSVRVIGNGGSLTPVFAFGGTEAKIRPRM